MAWRWKKMEVRIVREEPEGRREGAEKEKEKQTQSIPCGWIALLDFLACLFSHVLYMLMF